MARYYGSSEERGYGTAHKKLRRQLMARWRPGDPCARCGRPMWDKKAIDLGHTDDRTGYRGLEHSFCNRKAGAGTANRTKTQPKRVRPGGREYHQPCQFCGIVSRHAAQSCVICGGHFHPGNGRVQWACSRPCGVEYKRRKYGRGGGVQPRPRPPCAECGQPCKTPGSKFCSKTCISGGQFIPQTPIAYYTCRYCGKLGVIRATAPPGRGRREVCEARACQLARLAANNLVARKGITREQADAQVRGRMTASTHDAYGKWQAPRTEATPKTIRIGRPA